MTAEGRGEPTPDDSPSDPAHDATDRRGSDSRRARTARWGLTAIVFAAAGVRWIAASRNAVIFNDGLRFIDIAKRMAAGDWQIALSDHYHPLYSLVLALAHQTASTLGLAGPDSGWEGAGIAVSVVCGSLAVLPVFFFVRSAFGDSAAWSAAVLYVVHPYAVVFSADVQSEGLYLLLFLTASGLLWRAYTECDARLALAAGAVSGFAYLTRPEGLGVGVVGCGLAVATVIAGHWSGGRGARWVLALVVGIAVVSAPYVASLRAVGGEWTWTQKKSIAHLATGEQTVLRPLATSPAGASPELAQSLRCERTVVADRALHTPAGPAESGDSAAQGAVDGARALGELAKNVVGAMRPEMLVLLILGLVSVRGRPSRRGVFVAAFIALYATVVFALAFNVGYLSRRHVLPPMLLALGYAGLGVPLVGRVIAAAGMRLRPGAGWGRPGCHLVLALSAVVVLALPKALSSHRSDRLAERRAAEWLRDSGVGSVASTTRRTAFYAGAYHVALRDPNGRGRSVRALARLGAEAIVLDDALLIDRAGLEADCSGELQRVHTESAAGRSVSVYRLAGSTSAP